jgi:hypothetical protein
MLERSVGLEKHIENTKNWVYENVEMAMELVGRCIKNLVEEY